LINSMLYAIPVALAHLWLIIVPRFLIEVARVRRGACVRCGYDLQWDFINGCSECGWRRREEPSAFAPLTQRGGAEECSRGRSEAGTPAGG